MTTTVRQWTGLEAKALRAALRMTMRDFADYLGIGTRTVAKWEARGSDIQPIPQTQAILDTALAKASSDVQARFAAAVSDSLASRKTQADASSDLDKHSSEASGATPSLAPIPHSRVLLPVVIDGHQILLQLNPAAVADQGLALTMNPALSLSDPSPLEIRPANLERALELYLRGKVC